MTPAAAVPVVRWLDTRAVTVSEDGLRELGPGDRARAAAFTFAADRHRYRVAHIALRRTLSGYTGIPPGQLEFGREPCPCCGGPGGRPALAGHRGLHFSLAHSGDAVAIAVAVEPVGIDIERMPGRCTCDLASAMHGDDAAIVGRLPEPQRHDAIMRWWTGAEAVLKCTGAGIGHGMDGFGVLGGRPPDGSGGARRAAGCWLMPLAAPPGYAAALALRSARPPAGVTVSGRGQRGAPDRRAWRDHGAGAGPRSQGRHSAAPPGGGGTAPADVR